MEEQQVFEFPVGTRVCVYFKGYEFHGVVVDCRLHDESAIYRIRMGDGLEMTAYSGSLSLESELWPQEGA